MPFATIRFRAVARTAVLAVLCSSLLGATLPDGRAITPEGFTIPVEGFAADVALSPDGRYLAVLAEDAGALDVISTGDSRLVDRLAIEAASGLTWTRDGLYVTRGYTGTIARYAYDPAASKRRPAFAKRDDLTLGAGLLNGIAEDPATHRLAVARTSADEVVVLDDATGTVTERYPAGGQPYAVAIAHDAVFAALYDSNRVRVFSRTGRVAATTETGAHPTRLLAVGDRVYVADADGTEVVALDTSGNILKRYDLGLSAQAPPGQTPSGMAVSDDGSTLFVAESGFNDVAVVDVASGAVRARIPTGWYPMAVVYVVRAIGGKDPRTKEQLWIASAQGLGTQPDPAGEWNGITTGLVQHLLVEPARFGAWSRETRENNAPRIRTADLPKPAIRHVVFIVRENKHFDEEFGDEPHADADPELVLYGRHFTPNAHALAERYTLFDDFMADGEASIYGHSWTTQGMANDYLERNAHTRNEATPNVDASVAWSIWPYAAAGEDKVGRPAMDFDWYRDLDQLPGPPRINVSGVFGPRGELIDDLARKGIPFRVYGEQMTMEATGRIAPALVAGADRTYPGAHIDFDVLDTTRAKLFLDDVRDHGLAAYTYLTLPTDHTAGNKPGFYTPASYVANNDAALGTIVAGLSKRRDWRNTLIFVTEDDAQGTGDHADSHRMPAFAIGPFVRRGFVDHTRYSIPSFLRTVEVLFGLAPLNIYDARATPMLDAFTRSPMVAPVTAIPASVALERNPGSATSYDLPIDGPESADIPEQEWASLRGPRALAAWTMPAVDP